MSTTQAAEAVAGSSSFSDAAARFAGGETIACSADSPFLLDAACVWYIVSGQVDVFTVRVSNGEPVGPRTRLLRASEGQALFGAGALAMNERSGLLAVGFQNT